MSREQLKYSRRSRACSHLWNPPHLKLFHDLPFGKNSVGPCLEFGNNFTHPLWTTIVSLLKIRR